MHPRSVLAAAAMIGSIAAPAVAQNATAEPPVVASPPPAKTETAPPTPTTSQPPATTETAPAEASTTPPPETVVVVPQPAPAPAEPVTIDPDAAYPNGFADPADPFANDMSPGARDQRGGFDWGLLGLLGLLGLVPLLRDRGGRRVVYVERDDEPRRVVRRDPPQR